MIHPGMNAKVDAFGRGLLLPSSIPPTLTGPSYVLEGRYFDPDEYVAVAALLRITEADRYGEVPARVFAAEVPRNAEALILAGLDSGGFCYDNPIWDQEHHQSSLS